MPVFPPFSIINGNEGGCGAVMEKNHLDLRRNRRHGNKTVLIFSAVILIIIIFTNRRISPFANWKDTVMGILVVASLER